MPLDITPAIDWAALEAERDVYLPKHRRCNAALDAALASINVFGKRWKELRREYDEEGRGRVPHAVPDL